MGCGLVQLVHALESCAFEPFSCFAAVVNFYACLCLCFVCSVSHMSWFGA